MDDLNADNRPDFFVLHSNRLFLSQPATRLSMNTTPQPAHCAG
jgi:hypothetical protein